MSSAPKSNTQTYLGLGAGGLGVFLMSKEILVLHAETVVVVAMGIMTKVIYDKAGGAIGEALDSKSDAIKSSMEEGKIAQIAAAEAELEHYKSIPKSLSGVSEIFEITKELNAMNNELAFRQMKHDTRAAAVKELEDFVKIESEVRAEQQADFVAQLEAQLMADLKGQESAILKQCVSDLAALSAQK